jgi:hypothetical protein
MMTGKPELLNEGQSAAYIGMSVAFLRRGRCNGIVGNSTKPPPHLKIGRSIKYDRLDLDRWLAECRVDPGARLAAALGQTRPRSATAGT